MTKNVDETDLAILRVLIKNARASYREIAGEIKVAVGTVQHRIQKMEKNGVLTGFNPLINYNKLGYDLDAIITLQTPRDKTEILWKKLKSHPNVKSMYYTTGDADIFMRVQFRNTQELHDFLMNDLTDEFVRKSETYLVLEKHRKLDKLLLK